MRISLFRSVASRSTFWFASIFGLTQVVLLAVVFLSIGYYSSRLMDEQLMTETTEVLSMMDRLPPSEVEAVIVDLADAHGQEIMYIRLLDTEGRMVASSDLSYWNIFDARRAPRSRLGNYDFIFETLDLGHSSEVRVLLRPAGEGLWIEAGHLMVHEPIVGQLYRTLVAVAIILIGCAAILGYSSIRRAMRGVNVVRNAAEAVGRSDFDHVLPIGEHGQEIDDLSRAFDEMRAKIKRLLDEQREIGTSIAHDLRRPLTRIRAMVEQTLTEGASKEDCRDTAYRIIEESDRLSAMISTLLEITELNAGASVYRQSTVDLTRVVLDACELYQPLIEEQDISLICRTLSDPAPIRGDKPRMQRMVGNLMDNAAKFTDPGGVIEVDISRTQTRVVLRIANSGEGIDPKDQERIFDRFFRGDKSRTTSGTGLGLSVVKAIVEAYDGTIHVGSRPGAGTAFTISFPRLAEH